MCANESVFTSVTELFGFFVIFLSWLHPSGLFITFISPDLPRPLLVSIYESIKKEQFKIPEDDGNDLVHTFFNPGNNHVDIYHIYEIFSDHCHQFRNLSPPLPIVQIKKDGYGNRVPTDTGTGRGDGLF